jgi:putative two-component system response regulator
MNDKQNAQKPVILTIDDNATNIDVVKGILAEDYLVQAALSGAMALKILDKKKPDLILLDIMMPDMDAGLGTYSARLCAETQNGQIKLVSLLAEEQTKIVVTLPSHG